MLRLLHVYVGSAYWDLNTFLLLKKGRTWLFNLFYRYHDNMFAFSGCFSGRCERDSNTIYTHASQTLVSLHLLQRLLHAARFPVAATF